MLHDLALLTARLVVGESMAAHGAQKAWGWFDGPGPERAGGMFAGLGFRPGDTYARAAAWNEIVSGQLIAAGLGGPAGPAMLISGMIVAMQSVHAKNGFFAAKQGIELPLLYSVGALALLGGGYGRVSLDRALGLDTTLRHPAVVALALAGAVAGALGVLGARTPAGTGPATPTFRGKNSPSNGESSSPAESTTGRST
jgi:putative oxidoreductase